MSRIRALEARDLPEVASLFEQEMASGSRTARPGMAAHFGTMFLDNPWVDPEVPALVFETGRGAIAAFLGSTVRPMRLGGRMLRMASPGPVFTEPELRVAAALLMRKYLAGPQDLTMADRQNLAVHRMLVALGVSVQHLQCLRWIRSFRPIALKGYHLAKLPGMGRFEPAIRRATGAVDALTARLRGRRPAGAPGLHGEAMSPRALSEALGTVAGAYDLVPAYTEAYLRWHFEQLSKLASRGRLTPVLLRDDRHGVVGWYVYFLKVAGPSQLFQIAAAPGMLEPVLQHLLHHAERGGAAALRGRLEPNLRELLRSEPCRYHQESCLLVHTRQPAVLEAIASGRALLSAMEGEVWVGDTFRPAA